VTCAGVNPIDDEVFGLTPGSVYPFIQEQRQ
jgi:hypothetical protein